MVEVKDPIDEIIEEMADDTILGPSEITQP